MPADRPGTLGAATTAAETPKARRRRSAGSAPRASADHVAAVRRFNRFHTRLVGALGEGMLSTDYSLPQVRVLYEIAQAPPDAPASASVLGRALGLDAGYLSRLIVGLESAGLVTRAPSAAHAKRLELALTATGRRVAARLDAASAREVDGLLRRLSPAQQQALVDAMVRIETLLGSEAAGGAEASITLRDPQPGDLGTIVQRQAALYAQEYGFDWTFEALVAQIVAQFVQNFVPGKERCWIAARDGQVVGSVMLVRQDDETAKLRLLYVEPAARGLGLGRRLVEACIAHAQAQGYRRMVLWTNAVLHAARHIYETTGFTLVDEEHHHSFGRDLVGQYWERLL